MHPSICCAGLSPLNLFPYVVFDLMPEGKARPFVLMRAHLVDASNKERWSTRYIVSGTEDFTFAQWANDDGAKLKSTVDKLASRAVDILMKDVPGDLPRDQFKGVSLEACTSFRANVLNGSVI